MRHKTQKTCTIHPRPSEIYRKALPHPPFVMPISVCTYMLSHLHYPSKSTITLASPRKRGGGTADTVFSLAVQYSDSPAFTILKLFRAVTVGIEINRSTIFKTSKHSQSLPPLTPHKPFPKPHYPSKSTTTLGSLAKGSWLATRLLLIINCLALRFKLL